MIKTILFICTANICRSPFAEKVLQTILMEKSVQGVSVHSAGVNALPGFSPPMDAIRIAKEFGIDVSGHLSRPVSFEMIQDASIIPVMNIYHMEKILKIDKESESKLKLLGDYGSSCGETPEENEIPDPYGFTPFHYRASFNIIRDCLNNLYKELFNTSG